MKKGHIYAICIFTGLVVPIIYTTRIDRKQPFKPYTVDISQVLTQAEENKNEPVTQPTANQEQATIQPTPNSTKQASDPRKEQSLANNENQNENLSDNNESIRKPKVYKVYTINCKGYDLVNVRYEPSFKSELYANFDCGEQVLGVNVASTDSNWIYACNRQKICGWVNYSLVKFFGYKTL